MSELKISEEDREINRPMEAMIPSYDAYMKKVTFGREQVLRQRTVTLARIKPGDCVLEVGCGTGSLTLAAKRQAGPAGQVYGIDVLPGMIAASQQKVALAHEEITFQLGSLGDIPFPEQMFDVVMGSFMIFHMAEETRRKGITEAFRVLKSGGHLLILDLAMPTHPLSRTIETRLLGFQSPDLRQLIPILESAGFSEIESGYANFRILGLSVIGYIRACARKN